MSQISTSAAAAKIAMVEISVAAAVIPAAWPVAQIVYFNQCDPEAVIATGLKWIELAESLAAASNDLGTSANSLTELQWSGQDRDAFDLHVVKVRVQFAGMQLLAAAVGIALIVVGGLLLLLVICYAIISTILFAFAVFIAAASATVVGSPAAASAMATATSIAGTSVSILKTLEGVVEAAGAGAAAGIGASMAIDTQLHLTTGDFDVLKDLTQAAIDGTDNVIAGFLSKLERDFVGYGIHTSGRHVAGSPNGPGYLIYGGMTQVAPAGKDDDGHMTFGPGGIVDNIWNLGLDGDAWNH